MEFVIEVSKIIKFVVLNFEYIYEIACNSMCVGSGNLADGVDKLN